MRTPLGAMDSTRPCSGARRGAVTLGATPINAGSLVFNTDGYLITGGTLTLGGSATISVVPQARATISSIVAGTSGLLKTGNGTLLLTNSSNSFSGDVAIKGGSIVITNTGDLGTGTTAISVLGFASTGSPGFSGGSLVLDGTVSPVTLTREVSVAGRGPGAVNNTGALTSVGNNTIAAGLTLGSTNSGEGHVSASYGDTTVSGGVDLGTGGLANFAGSGNWVISGVVTGDENTTDRFDHTNGALASTLWLQNASNNYTDVLRIDSGTVRVTDNGDLGQSTGSQSVDLNGGTLEVRTDTPDFSTRNINFRGNTTDTVFVDRGIGGSGLNQSFVFGNINNSATNGTLIASGRDGNNVTFNAAAGNFTWVTAGNIAFTNSLNGTLTLSMNITSPNEAAARTLTVTSTGETVLTGNYLQGTGSGGAVLVKTGQGVFFIQGTASTATGTTQISQGTLSIPNVASIPSGALLLGNTTTTAGTVVYTGGTAPLANASTLDSTTANDYVNANGSGALSVSGTISNSGGGAKTLVLGGTNTGANTVTSVIPAVQIH